MAIGAVGKAPRERRAALKDPIKRVENVSSDETLILVRGQGWKEVKIAAFSQVEILEPDSEKRRRAQREGKRRHEKIAHWGGHSHCAGLWDTDMFGGYQYAEGLRRGLNLLERLSSVNDGAPWIGWITGTNFPHATQVVDWSHSTQRLWAVRNAVCGKGNPKAAAWVGRREDELWAGEVERVVQALKRLNLDRASYPDEVRQARGYFWNNRERMRYDEAQAAGYLIGSGTVESGAKSVVQQRMRRPGRG